MGFDCAGARCRSSRGWRNDRSRRCRRRAGQQVADELEIEHSCASLEEMVQRKDIDAVLIATPDKFHAQAIRIASAAGKDILSLRKAAGHKSGRCSGSAARSFSSGRAPADRLHAALRSGRLCRDEAGGSGRILSGSPGFCPRDVDGRGTHASRGKMDCGRWRLQSRQRILICILVRTKFPRKKRLLAADTRPPEIDHDPNSDAPILQKPIA